MNRVYVVSFVATVAALALTGSAFAWHVQSATATAVCADNSYRVSATIVQSKDWPNAYVKTVTPDRIDGSTSGEQTVKIVIGWPNTSETQTVWAKVALDGKCKVVCPITEKIVYVDRPVEKIVVVEKIVDRPVDRIVEKVVYKDRVVTKTVVKWRTKIVRRPVPVPCKASQTWDSKTRTCKPRTPTG